MKKGKRILIGIAFAALIAVAVMAAACDRRGVDDPSGSGVDVLNHVCEDLCDVCGGCTSDCIHPVCSNHRCSCNVVACDHGYTVWQVEKKPTLGTEGRATSSCDKCGEPTEFTIPKLGVGDCYAHTSNSDGTVTYTYNNTEFGIKFTSTVSEYSENTKTYKFECEDMTLIKGAKTAVDGNGEGYIGWMSGANQVGNGFTFTINAAADCAALIVVGVGLRSREEVPLNATYSFTVRYGDGEPEDVPVDDEFIFPKAKVDATDWTETEIVKVSLKAGKNIFTMIHDTTNAGVNWNYFIFVSDVELTMDK